jgi:hypothetical protein
MSPAAIPLHEKSQKTEGGISLVPKSISIRGKRECEGQDRDGRDAHIAWYLY